MEKFQGSTSSTQFNTVQHSSTQPNYPWYMGDYHPWKSSWTTLNQPLFGGPEFWRYVRDSPHHESWDCLLVRTWATVFIPWIFNQVQYPKISHRWKQNHGTWWFFTGGTFFQAAAGLCNGRQVDTEARSPQLWLERSKPKRVSDGKLEQPVTREFCATKHVKTLNINVSDIEPRNLTPKSLAYITYIRVSVKIWYL